MKNVNAFFSSFSFSDVILLLGFVFQAGVFWNSFRTLKKDVDELKNDVHGLKDRMGRVERLEERIDGLEKTMDTRFDAIERISETLSDDMREIRQALYIPVKEEAAARYHAQQAARDAEQRPKKDKEPKTGA